MSINWLSARHAHSSIREAPEKALVHAVESGLSLHDMPWSQHEAVHADKPRLLYPMLHQQNILCTPQSRACCAECCFSSVSHARCRATAAWRDAASARHSVQGAEPRLLKHGHDMSKPGRLCRGRVRAAGELLRPAICVTARRVVPQVCAQPVRLPLPRRHVRHQPPEPPGPPVRPS